MRSSLLGSLMTSDLKRTKKALTCCPKLRVIIKSPSEPCLAHLPEIGQQALEKKVIQWKEKVEPKQELQDD